MRRILAVVAALALGGIGYYAWEKVPEDTSCFHYDVSVKSYKLCGTPAEIETQQFARGVAMGNDSYEYFGSIENCLTRADVQAEINDWPDRYRDAYKSGCRAATGPTYRQQTKRETNLPLHDKRAVKAAQGR